MRSLHHDLDERSFLVIWEVTRACQLACLHCRADAITRRDPRELNTAAGTALLGEIAGWGAPPTDGRAHQRRSLRAPRSHRAGANGTAIGLHMAVSPSVTPRLTRASLANLAEAGARAVSLSLDVAHAATHDSFRGIDGVLDAAGWVRDLGVRLQINTTVTRDNVEELPEILARVLLADVSLWSVFFLVPTGRGSRLTPLPAAEVEEVLHWLHDIAPLVPVKATEAPHFRRVALQRRAMAEAGQVTAPGPLRAWLGTRTAELVGGGQPRPRRPRPPIDVNAGRGFAFVDHTGDVYPSGFLPLAVGNVQEKGFRSIYRDAPLLRALRDSSLLHGRCGVCEYASVCGGSRSAAYAVSGDVHGEDPNCAYQPELLATR